jgi:hypothetical protein
MLDQSLLELSMDQNLLNIKNNMDRLYSLVFLKYIINKLELLLIMAFCLVKVLKKEPILSKFVLKEKFL